MWLEISEPMDGFIKVDRQNESTYRKILEKAQNGDLIKVRNGIYATPDTLASGMMNLESVVPGGILCLYSAWEYYGLSTQVPDATYLAVERKRKITLPKVLDIRPIYQKKELLYIGKTTAMINGVETAIYDRERCVCDAIKYRNKIGIDVMSEVLDSYLKYENRNMSLLADYARRLRVFNILSTYLNVKM